MNTLCATCVQDISSMPRLLPSVFTPVSSTTDPLNLRGQTKIETMCSTGFISPLELCFESQLDPSKLLHLISQVLNPEFSTLTHMSNQE